MKNLFICLICSTFILSVKAQSQDSLQVQLARKWVNSKTYALKMAESMPEDSYNFKPVPEEMSFKEQLLHIAQNIKWLSSSYLSVKVPAEKKATAELSKSEVIKILSDAYNFGLLAHSSLTKAGWNEPVKFFAGPMTRQQILILMHDHQTHHLGQLIVYVRLKGIKPLDYIGW